MPSAVARDDWSELNMPVERVVGAATAKRLGAMGIDTVYDLIYYFPFRLAHRGELMPIHAVSEGEDVTVVARVLRANLRPMNTRRGHILSVDISDGSHELSLTFFAKNPRPLRWHESRLSPGTVAIFSGSVSTYRGKLQLAHPDYELIENEENMGEDVAKATRPIPIYHATAAMPSWKIAKAVAAAVPTIRELPDPLPADYRDDFSLPARLDAIYALHMPSSDEEWQAAQLRMKHEEAFVLQAVLAQRAQQAKAHKAIACPAISEGILADFDARLPYTLTHGQRSVGEEISRDITQNVPMRRLLQGDVGSGKTVVALRAMLQVVDAGYQAVLLAPTEVLAGQHYETISNLLGPLALGGMLGQAEHSTRVELLTGSMSAAQKKKALMHIASGEAGIIVGTHALLSQNVSIPRLALSVVDEQHRFGVDQRSALSAGVHTLVMTATPIPRTMAMTIFGDVEISTLRELPAGRKEVTTTIVPDTKVAWVARMWQRAAEEVEAGGRVYVVCPRIGDSVGVGEDDFEDMSGEEKTPPVSVTDTVSMLKEQECLRGIGIGVMHGRLKAEEKAVVMASFSSGESPILVSTTVIEVGVDVPEATMMIIMDAQRFGLSQLHQLRGRIGRGDKPGLCLAVTSALDGTAAAERLTAFASTCDGFRLAEYDVDLRREGDVLGVQQSGRRSHLRFLSVTKDEAIIEAARARAHVLLAEDPTLASHTIVREEIARLDSGQAEYLEKS